MVTFRIDGGRERAFDIMRRAQRSSTSPTILETRKSLITHPASTTHRNIGEEERARVGIGENMLRLSVGLEETSDLLADLTQAIGGTET